MPSTGSVVRALSLVVWKIAVRNPSRPPRKFSLAPISKVSFVSGSVLTVFAGRREDAERGARGRGCVGPVYPLTPEVVVELGVEQVVAQAPHDLQPLGDRHLVD